METDGREGPKTHVACELAEVLQQAHAGLSSEQTNMFTQILLVCEKVVLSLFAAMDMHRRRPPVSPDIPAQPVGTVPQVMSPNGVQGGILDGEVAGPAYGAVDIGLLPNGVSCGDQTVALDGGRQLDASSGQPDLGQTIGHELVQLEPMVDGRVAETPQNFQQQQELHLVQADGAFQARERGSQMSGAEWTTERHVVTRTAGGSSPTTMMRWLTRITEVLRTTTDVAGEFQGRVLGGLGLTPGQGMQGSRATPVQTPTSQQRSGHSSSHPQPQQQGLSPPEELRMPLSWTGESGASARETGPLFGVQEMQQLWDGVRRAPLLYGPAQQQGGDSTGSSK